MEKEALKKAECRRLGVIEIGSRATRLLVAEVYGSGFLRQRYSRVQKSKILDSFLDGENDLMEELARVSLSVHQFIEEAQREGVADVTVFGTEAIRRASSCERFCASDLANQIDLVLDAKTEALCSLVAGNLVFAARDLPAGACLVIDQGSGSTEIALGNVVPEFQLTDFTSLALGGNLLVQMLNEQEGDMYALRDKVIPLLDRFSAPSAEINNVVIMGTVATKCAWLTKRRDKTHRYDPKRVEGTIIPTSVLHKIFAYVAKFASKKNPDLAWERFQEYVNPGEPGGDAGKRVASGIVPLIEILTRVGCNSFNVSSLGTRHGFAILLAHSPEMLSMKCSKSC